MEDDEFESYFGEPTTVPEQASYALAATVGVAFYLGLALLIFMLASGK